MKGKGPFALLRKITIAAATCQTRTTEAFKALRVIRIMKMNFNLGQGAPLASPRNQFHLVQYPLQQRGKVKCHSVCLSPACCPCHRVFAVDDIDRRRRRFISFLPPSFDLPCSPDRKIAISSPPLTQINMEEKSDRRGARQADRIREFIE